MKDRVPTYPGRVRLTHVSDDIYDMSMEDEPTEIGTPLSKSTLLKDSTAAKYGFQPQDNPTPDDIFNAAFDSLAVVRLDGVWTSHDIARFDAQNLSSAGEELAGGSIGGYAVFAGAGGNASVDAYGESYFRTTAPQLSVARESLACASNGTYLLFAGGLTTSSRSAVVDAYDETLTRTTAPQLSAARAWLAGATVGNHAIFAGGDTGSSNSGIVESYDDGLTRTVMPSLDQWRSFLSGTSTDDYAIFAGGGYSTKSAIVDAYDTFLTHVSATQLSVARTELSGASVGGYALFAGGDRGSNSSINIASPVVDSYDSFMTRTTATSLSTARYELAGVSIDGFAIFAGGRTDSSSDYALAKVDAYDTSLTRRSLPDLSAARRGLAGSAAGDSAVFAGGFSSYSAQDSVDAYKMAYGLNLTIPAWSKYSIAGVSTGEQLALENTNVSALADTPFNGYIKRGFILSGEI